MQGSRSSQQLSKAMLIGRSLILQYHMYSLNLKDLQKQHSHCKAKLQWRLA